MQRPSAMHLPLDIYTLIGRYVRILLPLERSYNKRMILVKAKICLPRESQYPGTSRNTIRFTSCTRRGDRDRARVPIYFPPSTGQEGGLGGGAHKGFSSLSLRTHNAKAIAAPSVFYRKLRRKSIQAGGVIFRWLGEKDSNICCEYGYEVWTENIKMYRT